MALLTLAQFQSRTVMPAEFVDAIEVAHAGWIAAQLEQHTAWIYARLAKRYAVPFTDPVPEIALSWLTRIVTFEAWQRRGYDPADLSITRAEKDADTARAEVLEAAESEKGLFELPLRQDAPSVSGVSRGGPFAYSETSPYVWRDVQVGAARVEDNNGRGSGT